MKQINIDEETRFASKMPLSFYAEVSNGIHQFHDYKKKRKNMLVLSEKELSTNDRIYKPDFNTRSGRELLAFYLQTKFSHLYRYCHYHYINLH